MNTIAGLVVVAAAASCIPAPLPPPQQQWQPPQQQPADATAAAHSESAVEPGTCDAACTQVAACELVPYETCVDSCRQYDQQTEADRARLDGLARSSCDQLAGLATESPPAADPPPGGGGGGSIATAGRWVSEEWASVTNAAMASADFYLAISVGGDGAFHGQWARYVCLASAYGILSCSKTRDEGSATGQLDGGGGGWIDLAHLGRSSLVWTAKPNGSIAIELPRTWQGENVLFRSTLKR